MNNLMDRFLLLESKAIPPKTNPHPTMYGENNSPDAKERNRLAGEESLRRNDYLMGRAPIINGPEDARIWAIARQSEAASRMVHAKPMTGFAAGLFAMGSEVAKAQAEASK